MRGTIQVYVESEEKLTTESVLAGTVSGHPCAGGTPDIAYKKEQVLPEAYRHVINLAKKVAEEKGVKIKVYDKSSKMGRLKALLKGANETPTIIIGNQRITGDITEKKLLSLL
jgi:isopentenyldiphosphate isomerase